MANFLNSINLNKNQLMQAAVENLSTAPSNPVEGQIYFHTTDKVIYIRIGAAWKPIALQDYVDAATTNSVIDGGTF